MVGKRKAGVTKGRSIAFDERDEIAFVRILREKYPNVKFTDHRRHFDQNITVHDWPCLCNDYTVSVFVPDTDNWKPLILPAKGLKEEFYLHLPRRHFTFERPRWGDLSGTGNNWAFESPFVSAGEIRGSHFHGDDEQRLFLNTVWRLVTKVTKNLGIWCGYSAIEYASKAPRRLIDGVFPAPEGWQFPEDCPYYRDELWDDNPPEFRLVREEMFPDSAR